MAVPLLGGRVSFVCPNCDSHLKLQQMPAKPVLHPCRGLKGLMAPMIREGVKAKVEAHEREDYVNGDLVQTDGEGRPVMSVVTTRDDGQDVAVFAPLATARGEV